MGKKLLVAVDSYSKWIDVFVVSSASTEATLESLRVLFANNGIPEVLVSDNGTSFTSVQFKEFVTRNGIKHVTTAPYHPSSNGLAERAVQTVKDGLKKMTVPLQTRHFYLIIAQHLIQPLELHQLSCSWVGDHELI